MKKLKNSLKKNILKNKSLSLIDKLVDPLLTMPTLPLSKDCAIAVQKTNKIYSSSSFWISASNSTNNPADKIES